MIPEEVLPANEEYDLSVLTPSYGYGSYLGMAIDSTMRGSGLKIEQIIQDAGSPDQTEQVLLDRRERFGEAVKWEVASDRGQSDALNKALTKATGRWIGWLNADEFYLPGGLDALVAAGDQTGADVIYGDAVFVDEEGGFLRLKPQHPFSDFILLNYGVFISTCAAIMRRDVLWGSPWDRHLGLLMDHDFYLKLARRSAKFLYVPYPVAAFRVHPERVSARPEAHMGDYAIVAARHGRGGKLAQKAGRLLHASYKFVSGGYRRQNRASALVDYPMTWTTSSSNEDNFRRLLARCYGRRESASS